MILAPTSGLRSGFSQAPAVEEANATAEARPMFHRSSQVTHGFIAKSWVDESIDLDVSLLPSSKGGLHCLLVLILITIDFTIFLNQH